ncbi:3-hydroxyacyl-CoA dehydrogenase family protein [Agrococcus terreus]|uniref:3-hydroxyacyl-CoA dehydrogenase n=1 Tax=Agrococcus terreus TaxID=574649 RepID=A0ABQ2KQS2_9MICO|nr:3-hydroxyacyl-CoA dehydrogenase family protein [Agrococcus terreus]GGN89730.1 3-hydroxyacyl-CoA dehydrogenase [Agrococcus terreus]
MSDSIDTTDAEVGAGAPERVGVLGGGRMGAGIAHAFVLAGSQVVVVERDAAAAASALERVRESLRRSVERGWAEPLDELEGRLTTATDMAAFAGCGLVVEAVPEDEALKADALARVEAVLAPTASLASNTSSISITRLAAGLARPGRFVGLHFFNPVPASGLVEIVLGEETGGDLANAARAWVEAIGKVPVTVHDAPGFASSRLGVAIGLEAIRMVEEGVASPGDIDAAMELGYKHPMGPLRLTDVVGLDVRLGIAEQLERDLGPRFAPPALLRQMVAEGRLGRKAGRGFYDWD